jgi:hypothetical protein
VEMVFENAGILISFKAQLRKIFFSEEFFFSVITFLSLKNSSIMTDIAPIPFLVFNGKAYYPAA